MKTTAKIEFNTYLALCYYLHYRKIGTIITSAIGLIMLAIVVLDFMSIASFTHDPTFQLTIGVVLLFIIPILYFFIIKKTYKMHKILNDEVTYEFDLSKMRISSKDFNTEISLASSYKVEELNSWFLVYYNKTSFTLIPKVNLSKEDIQELRYIFSRLKETKLKLKFQ